MPPSRERNELALSAISPSPELAQPVEEVRAHEAVHQLDHRRIDDRDDDADVRRRGTAPHNSAQYLLESTLLRRTPGASTRTHREAYPV